MITNRLVWLLVVGALVGCNKGLKKGISVTTDEQKFSYAVGRQVGMGLKQQGLKVDAEVLAVALADALEGKPSLVKEEDLAAAMRKKQQEMMTQHQSQGKGNLSASKKYLEESKKNPKVKTTASGLQYEVVKEGTGSSPSDDNVVSVHYRGTLTDGKEFDSSYKRGEPAQFPVRGVIRGWTEALKMMKVGSKWKLTIPPELGYGEMGNSGIPPNAVLLFDVELIDIAKGQGKPAPNVKGKKG